MGVFEFTNNWSWLFGLVLGGYLLLIVYRVVPVRDEAAYKKNARTMRVCGFLLILGSIGLAVLRFL